MASASLASFDDGIAEVRDLQAAAPKPTAGTPGSLKQTRAVGRASVVILASHLEGYIDSINLEAAGVVNAAGIAATQLSEAIRLLHSKSAVDAITETSWEGQPRAKRLEDFISSDAWLWGTGRPG